MSCYEKVRPLGSGAHGNVFLVRHQLPKSVEGAMETDNFLVLKEPKEDCLWQAKNERNILAYIKESLTVDSAKGSDNYFVRLDHFVESKTGIDIYTEYLQDYVDLFDFVTIPDHKKGLLMVYEISRQLIDGLKVLHELQIVHFDPKLENILVDQKQGKIKFIDFGSSWYHGPPGDKVPIEMQVNGGDENLSERGTPEYKAPELFCRELFSSSSSDIVAQARWADIWSLGQTLFALLTGHTFLDSPVFRLYLSSSILAQNETRSFTSEEIADMWNDDWKILAHKFPGGKIPVNLLAVREQRAWKFKQTYPVHYETLVDAIENMLSLIPANRKLTPYPGNL